METEDDEYGNGGVRNQREGLEGQDGSGRLHPECKITRSIKNVDKICSIVR